jgi:polar amino acid transport system substrate-binding protein
MTAAVSKEVLAQLTPTGALRAGINLSNFLLVTGRRPNGDPDGVSPDVAEEIAKRLGVPCKLVAFKSPGELGDQAGKNIWDIGNIGAEPQRAKTIAFTAAYAEIESTYLVPAGSPIQTIADVDKPGNRIAVAGRSAYGLWLENNVKQATLVTTEGLDGSFNAFVEQKLEALAGLRPRLIDDVKKLPGARILEGQFSAVQQAVGTAKANTAAAAWLSDVVEELKASGFVAAAIAKHKANGLSVAPPAKR